MKNSYTLVVTQDSSGTYIAYVPGLEGCHTQAKTLPELYVRAKEAIELCLASTESEIQLEKFIEVKELELSL